MSRKKVVVIGASRGIGLELCRTLVERGNDVVATCRTPNNELSEVGCQTVLEGIDVNDTKTFASLESIAHIDWLVVVAGVLQRGGFDDFTDESIRFQFETNALAPLRIVRALHKNVVDGGKIGLLTSRMGSVADNTSGGSYGYRMSKAALNMVGKSLAIDLPKNPIALIHPGWVRTDMTGGTGHLSPLDSAKGIVARMEAITLEESGSFVHVNGDSLPW